MAKNMQNTSYRKLDVDAYDAERYDDNDDAADSAALGPDERSVTAALNTNRLTDALRTALSNPPLKTKDQGVKDRSTLLVAKVLGSFKSSDIEAAVKEISDDEGDILLKYVYKAMELCPDNALCASLLTWHAQLVARFGLGGIVRVFSHRQHL